MPNFTPGLLCVPLLGFFLYLLTRWDKVEAKWAVFGGLGAMALVLIGQFFVVGSPRGRGLWVVKNVFECIGAIVGLAMAFMAGVGSELSIKVGMGSQQEQAEQTPQP